MSSVKDVRDDEYTETLEDGRIVKKRIRRVDLSWEGTKLTLPVGMDYDEAIKALEKRRDEDNQKVRLSHTLKAFPTDGAVALQKALREKYGWTSLEPRQTFWGEVPPTLIPVYIGHDEQISVPWGEFTVPNIRGELATGWTMEDGLPQFQVRGVMRRADQGVFEEIVKLTKHYIATESIYKGQAIKLKFRDEDGDRIDFSPDFCPRFMDLKSFDPTELVLPEAAANSARINLWNPIEFSDYCRRQRIPLKRGILLEGGFGTGKTLTAFQTASLCVKNGWTFVMLDEVRDIAQALAFARLYEPCLIFAEDVDKAVSGARTTELNHIFNTIDGIESKGRDIMTVLTTNLVGDINPGFIRPGRIDAIITVGPPDDPAIVKLTRRYSQDYKGESLLDSSVTDEQIVEAMTPVKGANAAFIREVIERAKLSAVSHADGEIKVFAKDLREAASSMESHLLLVNPKREPEASPLESVGNYLMENAAQRFVETLADPITLKRIAAKASKKLGS